MSGYRVPVRLHHLSEDTGREVIELVADHAPRALASTIAEIIACSPGHGLRRMYDAGTRVAESELTRLRAALAEIQALQPIEPRVDDHPSDTGFARALGRRQCASLAAKELVSK